MKLLRFVRPYRKYFTLGSLAKLTEAMLELYLPILMARIIDVGIPTGNRAFIWRTSGLLLLLALAGFGFAAICQYFAALTSQGTGTVIRNALIEKISSFSYRELDRFGTSTLITRITSDVNYVQQAVAMTMRLVTRAPFICIGAVIMSVSIHPRLSIIFTLLIPVLGLMLYLFLSSTAPLYRRVQQKLDQFSTVVRENLSGVRVIRAFARTGREQKRAKDAADDLSSAFVQVSGISALMNPATSIVLNIGIIAVLYFGASYVYRGELPQGDLLALTTYATKILYALIVIANLVVLFTKAGASSARIQEVLAVESSIREELSSSLVPQKDAPCISFEHVSFSYGGKESALRDVSFQLEQGQVLGVVGVTGSGKTTLINLLQRFYDADEGDVKLYGLSVRHYPQQALREIIGVVPQRNTLFSGTILDNIRWGKEDATEAEAAAALQTAQCWEFVEELPQGVHSLIHEGGKNFSGGQRQRLTIARAIVGRPAVLILDDSLSALDYRTDRNLRQALDRDLAGATRIIVSQRISSVVSADRILVLGDGGAVEGIGTHGELLESCPAYRSIYASQSGQAVEDISQEQPAPLPEPADEPPRPEAPAPGREEAEAASGGAARAGGKSPESNPSSDNEDHRQGKESAKAQKGGDGDA